MPGGDASNMLFRLRNAERFGLITPEQARLVRLTAAKDMATGLSQLHENRGMMHYDVKPGNFLISGTGVVKLSDFGTTRPEQEMHGEALSKSTTQVFMSPEVSRAPLRMAALNDEIRRLTTRADQRGFTKEALSDLARAQKAQNEIDTLSADRRGDVFSLGLSFVSAFEGKHLGGQYMQLWGRIEDLGTGSTSKRNAVLAELGVTSNSPEHQLIRAMLAGDPANRPTARDVANAQVFSDPRVGSPQTRQLMLDVAQGKYDPPRNRGAL